MRERASRAEQSREERSKLKKPMPVSANAALLPADLEAIEASRGLIWARHRPLICYCSMLVRCTMPNKLLRQTKDPKELPVVNVETLTKPYSPSLA